MRGCRRPDHGGPVVYWLESWAFNSEKTGSIPAGVTMLRRLWKGGGLYDILMAIILTGNLAVGNNVVVVGMIGVWLWFAWMVDPARGD